LETFATPIDRIPLVSAATTGAVSGGLETFGYELVSASFRLQPGRTDRDATMRKTMKKLLAYMI
jgi:hypothetical protein